jgi:hypothetical protein
LVKHLLRSCTHLGPSCPLSGIHRRTHPGHCRLQKCSSANARLRAMSITGQPTRQLSTHGLQDICLQILPPWRAFQPFHAFEGRTVSSPRRRLFCQTWTHLHQQILSCTLLYRPVILVKNIALGDGRRVGQQYHENFRRRHDSCS